MNIQTSVTKGVTPFARVERARMALAA